MKYVILCKYIILSYFFITIPCHSEIFNVSNQYSCYEHFGFNDLVIEPRTTIYGLVNHTLTVECISNPIHNISSDVMFFKRGPPSQAIYESHQDLNENTISLNISEDAPSKFQLTCQDSQNNKCIRQVIIGYPPLNVQNFRCVSISWTSLECSYDLAENPAQRPKDNYILSYLSRGKSVAGYKCEPGQLDQCCHIEGKECWRWDGSGDFLYDDTEQYLNFTISSANPLGYRSYTYIINQFETMIPDPVSQMKLLNKDDFQIHLFWRLPTFLNLFPPGIIYRIKIEVCRHEEQIIDKIQGTKFFSEKLDSKYPGQLYKISVTLRSGNNTWNENDSDDQWWSRTVTQTITTPSLPPKYVPTSTIGSFHVHNWESNVTTLTIYWKDVDDCLKGGKGFTYSIDVLTSDGRTDIKHTKITENYAVYENFIFKDKGYIFHITPINEAGHGNASTIIEIGRERLRPKDVFFPIVIYHSDDELLQLKWFSKEEKVNFTLFWCSIEQEFEGSCKSISWKLIFNETETNVTTQELGINEELELQNLRVGVSTQKWYEENIYSSGIVWAACLIGKHDPEISREAPSVYVVNKTSSSAEIIWELDCKTWKGFPQRIEIIWCEGEHNTTFHCAVTTKMADINTNSYELKNLKPKQNYTIWIRIHFKYFKSEFSAPTYFRTDKQMLSYKTIVIVIVLTIFVCSVVILIVVHSPKKLKKCWRDATQKLKIPSGLQTKHNYDTKKDTSFSSTTERNSFLPYVYRLIPRKSEHAEEMPSEQPLLITQNALKVNLLENSKDLSKTTLESIFTKQDVEENETETNFEKLDVGNTYDELQRIESSKHYRLSLPIHESKLVVNETLNSSQKSKSYSDLPINSTDSSYNTGYVPAATLYQFSESYGFEPKVKNKNKSQNIKCFNDCDTTINNGINSNSYSDLPTFVNKNTPSGYIQALSPTLFSQHSFHELDNISKVSISQNQSYSTRTNKSYSTLPDIDFNKFAPLGYVQALPPSLCRSLSNQSNLFTSIYNMEHMNSLSYVDKKIEIKNISISNPYTVLPIISSSNSLPEQYIHASLPITIDSSLFEKDGYKSTYIYQNGKTQNNPSSNNCSKLINTSLQERTNPKYKSMQENMTLNEIFTEGKIMSSIKSQDENRLSMSILPLVEENETLQRAQRENQKIIKEYITLTALNRIIINGDDISRNTSY